MKALGIAAAAALAMACCAERKGLPSGEAAASTASVAPARPRASGRVTVRGGETIELAGARVVVGTVTYLNQPCPPDVQCIHSGVVKQVELTVIRTGAPVLASLREGERKVVDGVELAVDAVRAGPEADVEATLTVAPVR
jgi:hypothetical protein